MSLNDIDIDTALLRQFRTMGTADKDVLVCHFKNLLGNNVSSDICDFYLEMNDWNLQAAISSYFDYELDSVTSAISYSMLVSPNLSSNIHTVLPQTDINNTWLITNNGGTKWPIGCHIKHMSGEAFTTSNRIMVNPLEPGEHQEMAINISSPLISGYHRSVWRLCTFGGVPYGDILTIEINVLENYEMADDQILLDDQATVSHATVSQPMMSQLSSSDTDINDVEMS